VISWSQRPLPNNTQHSQQTNVHAPSGIIIIIIVIIIIIIIINYPKFHANYGIIILGSGNKNIWKLNKVSV